ncbi:outer membrane protein [Pseudomonas sp. NPDC089752]|uniref:outer membrane protein n=1 Tax=Pseudomonas sp. NPDC089752 TaxID=3364472 RepID=UPI00382F3B56
MQIRKRTAVYLLAASAMQTSIAMASSAEEEGYYGAARLINVEHKARNMDSSARPGIGAFVSGDDRHQEITGSFAVGYRFGNGWRLEGELSLPQKNKFTSGSSAFPTSLNEHQIESRRVMFNIYRDQKLTQALSIYASAGLGLAQLESAGWQGNESRQYGTATQTNLAWSLGAGLAYEVTERMTLDLGYRYVDMGNTESGWNNFQNVRGLQDEKMRANLVSSELHLGMRWAF